MAAIGKTDNTNKEEGGEARSSIALSTGCIRCAARDRHFAGIQVL